VIDKIIL